MTTNEGRCEPPPVGAAVKVWVPGETPWAVCVFVYADGTWEGRIDNHLFGSALAAKRLQMVRDMGFDVQEAPDAAHNYKYGDVIRWQWSDGVWRPTEAPGGAA